MSEETKPNDTAVRIACMKCGSTRAFADGVRVYRFLRSYGFRLCEVCLLDVERLPELNMLAGEHYEVEAVLHHRIRHSDESCVRAASAEMDDITKEAERVIEAWLADGKETT